MSDPSDAAWRPHDHRAAPAGEDAFSRWRGGGHLEGVHFAFEAPVVVLEGDHAGTAGRVVSLQALAPEPVYVVAFANGDDVGVVQSGLRAAVPGDDA